MEQQSTLGVVIVALHVLHNSSRPAALVVIGCWSKYSVPVGHIWPAGQSLTLMLHTNVKTKQKLHSGVGAKSVRLQDL